MPSVQVISKINLQARILKHCYRFNFRGQCNFGLSLPAVKALGYKPEEGSGFESRCGEILYLPNPSWGLLSL
jgi:hypothetical protein